ncbi:hypothetical protein KAW18_17980, partial [candidate division WOR-3 bacterium]|nr:hypothetical protein [candidate division WOR-3 bacterium]
NAIFAKLGSIKEGLGDVLGPVKTAIHTKLAAIKDGLAEKLAPVTTIVLNALSNIKDKLDPIIAPLKTAIHNKLGGIKEGLEEKLAPVKTAIERVFTSAVGTIETSFADLPTAIGTIFTTIGKAITTFGENLPGFLGTSVADLGQSFTDLGDSFKIPTEDIETDLGEVTGHIDTVSTAVGIMKEEIEKVPSAVATVAEATGTMQTEVEKDVDKINIDVDGVKLTFDGLKGKIGDVVTEFGNFEDIAGTLIGLDWSVFTTLKEELPEIDEGIGDMEEAFGDLKTVLDDNIDNFDSIQKDLGDIEQFITPFVNNIAPGITAIGNFGKALSDTQSALGVFASMSKIDLEGMLGFESAVHSMVMGLDILEGQMERLMPSFGDIKSVITRISTTFVYSGGRAEAMAKQLRDAAGAMNETGLSTEELWVRQEYLVNALMDMGVSGNVAYEFWHRLRDEQ